MALAYLAGSQRRLALLRPQRFDRLAGATLLVGAAWGVVTVLIWDSVLRLTWKWWLNWVIPSAACAVAAAGGPFRRAGGALIALLGRLAAEAALRVHRPTALRLIRTARRWRAPLSWVMLALLAVAIGSMLNDAARSWDPDFSTRLHPRWRWLWPRALYRVLLLTPLWGAWSMLAIGQFHRPDRLTDAPTRAFAEGVGPLATAAGMGLTLGGTLVWLSFLSPWNFVPPAVALAAALAGGSGLARLSGRLCREVLLATNLLTQLAFLSACLAVR